VSVTAVVLPPWPDSVAGRDPEPTRGGRLVTGLPAARSRPHVSGPRCRWLTLLAMCVSLFIIQVDVTIVNVALPSIPRSS
jgi:hypothetical protein